MRSTKYRYVPWIASVLVAACGGAAGENGDPAKTRSAGDERVVSAPSDRRVPYTPANDLELTELLIDHHRSGIEITDAFLGRGSRPDVESIARRMREHQSRELEMLTRTHRELSGGSVPPSGIDPAMSRVVERLRSLSGADADAAFLETMISHHASALASVHRSMGALRRADLHALADSMVRAQAREIGEMEELRDDRAVAWLGADADRPGAEGDPRIPYVPESDRAFAAFFLDHHQMAVRMARYVVEQGADPRVRSFAQRMTREQEEDMTVLRDALVALPPDDRGRAMPRDGRMEREMERMMSARGAELDRLFVSEMMAHHAAGLAPALRGSARIGRSELRSLASRIFASQARDMGELAAMLGEQPHHH